MAVPKFYEFMRPFLEVMSDGKAHSLKEIRSILCERMSLSESDMNEVLPSGREKVYTNRIGWASTYLKKAGLIISPSRAVFRITPEGTQVLSEAPSIITPQFLTRYDEFKTFKGQSTENSVSLSPETTSDSTPDDILEEAFLQISATLEENVLAEVMKLSPTAFEKMLLDLLKKMGYGTFDNASSTTPISNDEGIDGIIMEDKLGFDLIYIQAKHYALNETVGRPDIQRFVGAIAGRGGKGLFVTTSTFTKQAQDYASKQHIILMDGIQLVRAMVEHDFGVYTKRTFAIKSVDNDTFADYADE